VVDLRKLVSKLYIGTSGYSYSHWENGVFYPRGLPKLKQLEYYTNHFNTVEMNYPFYRLPSSKSFFHWKEVVPKGFIFAVKVSRYITHIKYLYQCKDAWKTFFKRALYLEQKLGPFLFQLPPNWHKDLDRLHEFIELVEDSNKYAPAYLLPLRFVLEFRHLTWFSEDVYQILRKQKNISLCMADSPVWPLTLEVIGDFVYIRMHGGKILYGSNYSEKELQSWAERIKKWQNQGLDVYVYFNNDAYGYAVKNAKELLKLCKEKGGRKPTLW